MHESQATFEGVRQTQKRETRGRVLAAARQLFAKQGFERTTIRQIAQAAGVSSGSVMAHYKSKMALLLAIMQNVNQRQLALLRETLPKNGHVCEQIMHMFRIYAAFDLEQPSLAAAVAGHSWQWDEDTEMLVRQHFEAGDGLLHELLQVGVSRGEIDPAIDLVLAVKMTFALYTRALRQAIFDQKSASEMMDRFERQIDLFYRGLSATR